MNNKPWVVKYCLLDRLEDTLNDLESNGYVIDKYETIPESFHWVVVGHLLTE
jgi:hypothetical protein